MIKKSIDFIKKKYNANINLKFVIKGGFFGVLTKALVGVAGVLSTFIVANFYGPEATGLLAIIISILNLSASIAMLGTETSIVTLISEFKVKHSKDQINEIYLNTLKIVLWTAIIISLLFLCGLPFFNDNIFNNKNLLMPLLLCVPFIIMFSLYKLNLATARAYSKIKTFNILNALQSVVFIILLAIFFLFYKNVKIPIYLFLVSVLVSCVFSFFAVKKILSLNFHKQLTKKITTAILSKKQIISESAPFFVLRLLYVTFQRAGILILGAMASSAEVGIYSVVLTLGSLTNLIPSSSNIFLAPKIAELYHSKNKKDLEFLMKKITKYTMLITLPIFLILIFFGKFILGILGEEFIVGYYSLLIISTAFLLNSISGQVNLFMNMTGHPRVTRNINIASTAIFIILNIILIPKLGIIGASIAYLARIVLSNIVSALFIKHKFGFFMYYVPFLR